MIPGIEIERQGKIYVIPPLSLSALQGFQARLASYAGDFSTEALSTFQDVTLAAFKRNYPDMTREQLFGAGHMDEKTGEWIEEVQGILDLSDLQEVMAAVMDVSGVGRKALAASKKAAASNP